MSGIAETVDRPSAWVRRFVPLIRAGGLVLDLAAGRGRHAQLLLESGFVVRAVDRDLLGAIGQVIPGILIPTGTDDTITTSTGVFGTLATLPPFFSQGFQR